MQNSSEPVRPVFVGIGEVLFDVFEDGLETLGGAPLNVAVHLHQLAESLLLGPAAIVSCIGNDSRGERIRLALDRIGLSTRYLTTHPTRPTGKVSIWIRQGEPAYQIESDAAWDEIEASRALEELASTCDAVCFGSLAQRSAVSRATIRNFLVRAKHAVRLYDVNLRRNSVSGEEGYSAEIVDTSCSLATIIKANRSELFTVCELLGLKRVVDDDETQVRRAMHLLLARFPVHAVVVTSAAKGTILLTRERETRILTAPLPPDAVHPVGAGDACSAGILFGLTLGWSTKTAAQLGNLLGTWVASQQSATPTLPDGILGPLRERVIQIPQLERS